MRFISNYSKALSLRRSQLLYGFEGKRECLDCADHNFFAASQGFSQLCAFTAAVAFDGGNYAFGAFKVKNGFLQLCIQHIAVTDYQHTVKQFLVVSVMQIGKKVCSPSNRVCFA